MKNILRKLCWPILQVFEKHSDEEYVYEPSHRKILIVVGLLFSVLAAASFYFVRFVEDPGVYVPVIVFSFVALTCLIVGGLGSDKAVSKIWRNRKAD